VADLIAPAITTHDPPGSIFFNRLPAGVVAVRANHQGQVKGKVKSKK
jgi:hypothetical protein